MRNILLKTIGIFNILFAGIIFVGLVYIFYFADATIVIAPILKIVVFAIIMMISGIGIVFIKEKLFLVSFYAYTFFVLDRLLIVYQFFTIDKIESELPTLQVAIRQSAINSFILVAFTVALICFLLNKENLKIFNISGRKDIYKHFLGASTLFIVFSFFLY